jgi:nitronate monooxygenase
MSTKGHGKSFRQESEPMASKADPIIIQGGMGVAVSGWPLARAVSKTGQMGVISGTGIDVIMARRLQMGDPGGDMRRAFAEFPFREIADRVLDRFFIPGGKPADQPYIKCGKPGADLSQQQLELMVVSNFAEIYLARENHDGLIGVNYLAKIQTPTLPSLFGAMLAGADYVLMGAGIPRAIPGILDRLSEGKAVELSLDVHGADRSDCFVTRFDPMEFCGGNLPWLNRPKFLAIISSDTLANVLVRKASGYVDGFIVEGPTAGGHNAPPRGKLNRNDRGEPIYGERDRPNLDAIAAIGRPFWLAGSFGNPDRVVEALALGATGVQVGTAFAFCEQSGLEASIRRRVLSMSRAGTIDVFTDPVASPTGFPFKVLGLHDSLSTADVYDQRQRVCDLGYLRHAFKKEDGTLGWRCGAEDVGAYVRKGGDEKDTHGRKCVCNSLMANVGFGQYRRQSGIELPLVTSGDDARHIVKFLPTQDATSYSAEDVVAYLLSKVETGAMAAR